MINARLASALKGREMYWTDFFFGTLGVGDGLPVFHPLEYRSRLSAIAGATALASIPEGRDLVAGGSIISVQLLR